MTISLALFVGIFGLIVGSFLNVVSLRYKTGMGLGGRSKCFSCSMTLTWKELVPVFSFLHLRGKCKGCKTKISWQYPMVELFTGILFILIVWKTLPYDIYSALYMFLQLLIVSILIVILVYDSKHKIIPDPLVYAFIILAGATLFLKGAPLGTLLTRDILAGPILFIPFALIWLLSKGRAMGFGDAKLAWGIGWALGIAEGVSAVVIAFWIGALVGVYKIITSKRHVTTMKSELPFAPFLVIGMYLALWLSADIFHIGFFIDSFTAL